MDSYQCVELLAPRITDELIITNLGGVARELYYLKDREGNLYRPYMAFPTPMALGLALALPHRRVISLDGDGSILLGLTILPAIAQQNPSNLIVIILDNQAYEATGGPPTFTAGKTDLSGMAREAGVPNTWLVRDLREFEGAVDAAYQAEGASFITAKVDISSRRIPYYSLDGVENKYRFVHYVEKTESINILKKPKKPLPQDKMIKHQ